MSGTFLLVYFVCLIESTCETKEIVFYFTSEALFVVKIIIIFQVFKFYEVIKRLTLPVPITEEEKKLS